MQIESKASSNVAINFPNGKNYALYHSTVVKQTSPKTVPVTSNYANYMSYIVGGDLARDGYEGVKKDDIIIIRAIIEGTHQPEPGTTSVAEFSTYLTCEDTRISPYRVKSLRRSRGNHHGSMVVSGFCRAKNDSLSGIAVNLKARESLGQGLIHFGSQTKLFIDHYKAVDPVASNLDKFYLPTEIFKAEKPNYNLTFQDPNDIVRPTLYSWQSKSLQLNSDDIVFVNAQATAENPNAEIPMFGFKLFANNTILSTATENPTPNELYRISQYGYGQYHATNNQTINFNTRLYGLETEPYFPTMLARGAYSRLEGMIFKKGGNVNSRFLKKIHRNYPASDLSIAPNGQQYNLASNGDSVELIFQGPGFIRIKAYAHIKYQHTDVRSCYIRIGSKKNGSTEHLSTVSGRYMKAPYNNHNLSAEMIFEAPEAGTYKVRPFFYCSQRADQTPVILENTGTWYFIEHFE